MKPRNQKIVTAVSLFIGIGGFLWGLRSAELQEARDVSLKEFEVQWAVEDSLWREDDTRQHRQVMAKLDSIHGAIHKLQDAHAVRFDWEMHRDRIEHGKLDKLLMGPPDGMDGTGY